MVVRNHLPKKITGREPVGFQWGEWGMRVQHLLTINKAFI